MENNESTESGSPPVSVGGSVGVGGGGMVVVPEVINLAVNMSMERSLGVVVPPPPPAAAAASGGGAAISVGLEGAVAATGGGGGDLGGKKKRGRPRKYDSEGNLRLPYVASPHPPQALITPLPGFTLTTPSSGFSSSKRGRGRPPGSGNWQLLASLGELFADTAGGDFTPHVVNVNTGEDVAAKIFALAQRGAQGICVLSANGAVSNVTIRQPGSSGGILTYEGRFEILRLTGSFTISENGGIKRRTGGLSVSLASPDGRVIGGGIAGLLVAASPIQMVVGTFVPDGYKMHKRKHTHEYQMTPIQGVPHAVTTAKPISQAAPDGSFCLNPTPQFPVQSHGEANNSTSNKDNLNSTSTDTTNLSGSEPISKQRASPDINVSISVE